MRYVLSGAVIMLVNAVIKGTEKMPHHAGKPRLPRADIEAAVNYMIEKSK